MSRFPASRLVACPLLTFDSSRLYCSSGYRHLRQVRVSQIGMFLEKVHPSLKKLAPSGSARAKSACGTLSIDGIRCRSRSRNSYETLLTSDFGEYHPQKKGQTSDTHFLTVSESPITVKDRLGLVMATRSQVSIASAPTWADLFRTHHSVAASRQGSRLRPQNCF